MRLDEAVCDAYGWPRDIDEEETLQRLVTLNAERAAKGKVKKQPWPKGLPERIAAVRGVLAGASGPLESDEVAGRFSRARKGDVAELLETLSALGHARQMEDGRFVG